MGRKFLCPHFLECRTEGSQCYWATPAEPWTHVHSESSKEPLKIRCIKGAGFWIYACNIPYLDGVELIQVRNEIGGNVKKVEDITLVEVQVNEDSPNLHLGGYQFYNVQ